MNDKLENIFGEIYRTRAWQSTESFSGAGSEFSQAKAIIQELPFLLKKYNIKSMLDVPCGDYNWMRHVDLGEVQYIGADIVLELILENKLNYPGVEFLHLDLSASRLPRVDLIVARDVFVHMRYETIYSALNNIIKSGSRYLLTTTFTGLRTNEDLTREGGWRSLNLLISPFRLKPIYLINEDCTEGDGGQYNDKCLVLFEVSRLLVGT